MDIIHKSKGSRGVIYLDTLVITGVAGSGNGSIVGQNVPWNVSSWIDEYEAITSSRPLLRSDSNKVLSNAGAGASITLTLPIAANSKGAIFNIVRVASQQIVVDPNALDRIIYSGGVMSLGEFLRLDSDGAKLTLVSDGNVSWIATTELGTLTEETP